MYSRFSISDRIEGRGRYVTGSITFIIIWNGVGNDRCDDVCQGGSI